MIQVYGITGCDKVKAALDWLKKHDIAFCFHDLRQEVISAAKLTDWIRKTKGEVLNKRSTTWRSLPAEVQEKLRDVKETIKVMQDQPTIIKRPVIEHGVDIVVGFDSDLYLKKFK